MNFFFGSDENKSPQSPPPEMRQVVVTQTFNKMTTAAVFDLVFSKELAIAYQESQGNAKVEVGDWVDATTPDDTAAGITRKKRTLKYVVPMNVPIPKLMADSMGVGDTVTENVEECTVKGGVYTVTADCALSGSPMVSNVVIKPVFTLKPSETAPEDVALECVVKFSFNVWGLATLVEATMESGVKKGFEDMLTLAKKWSVEGRPQGAPKGA
eukprot:EG_transcript_16081